MKNKYKYFILTFVTIIASILIYNYVEKNTPVDNEEDILVTQAGIEEDILKDTNYSINNPKVILNPYGISPLSALVIFQTNDLAAVTVTIKGKDGDDDIVSVTMPSKTHLVPIYGLYPDYDNTVIISASDEEKELSIKTDKLLEGISEADAYDTDSDDFYFTTSNENSGYPVAYDKNGNVRWYLTKPYKWDFTRLDNGYILLGDYKLMKDPYYSSGLVEMDFLGKIYFEYNIPGGYHHDVYEKNNGNLILISNDFDSKKIEDVVVEIDRNTGNIVKKINYSKLFDFNGKNPISLNSIAYDSNTNSIIAVGNKKDMIINVDYNTEEINWIIGNKNSVSKKYRKYLLSTDDSVHLPIKPQSVALKDDSIVYVSDEDGKNSLVSYKINTYERTFSEVSYVLLDDYSHNTNIDYDDEFVIAQGKFVKKVDDDDVITILKTKNNLYSAKSSKMYNGEIFMTGPGLKLGSLGITPTVADRPVIIHKKDDSIYKHYNLSIHSDANRLIVKGCFKKTDKVQIILDNVLNKKTYDVDIKNGVLTTNGKYDTSTYINKQGVYGKYYIYLKINGVNYKLDKYVWMS